MLRKMKTKIRGVKGFSLAETLMAVLILLMVTSVVAGGIPAAAGSMYKIIDGSNAQVLLSTTLIKLRDELSMARLSDGDVINASGSKISYTQSNGMKAEITSTPEGLMMKVGSGTEYPFVSNAAANKNLHVECEFAYEQDNGIVVVKNFKVKKGDKEIATIGGDGTKKIKVVSFVA